MTNTISHTDKVNYLNIGLIVLSLGLAYAIPFKLFLFAYAVLGPLHYLTEISWLHKSKYFVKGKNDYLFLVALGVVSYIANFTLPDMGIYIKGLGLATILLAFVGSFCFLAFDSVRAKVIGILIGGLLSFLLTYYDVTYMPYFIVVGVFVPTIVHVCVFTFLFMLYGSMKSRSTVGYMSCVIFVLAIVIIFFLRPNINYGMTQYIYEPYRDTFYILSQTLTNLFNYTDIPLGTALTRDHYSEILFSDGGKMVMRFIAFIYLYHYLNWFSKTSIIKWHDVSKDKLIIIATLWVLSVILYAWDYKLGFTVLFTLSMMHVFLEFPLNFRSIQTIVRRMAGRE